MVKLINRIISRGIRSAGYELRHNPFHAVRQLKAGKPLRPRPPVVEVLPLTDIPCAIVALDQSINPLPEIMQSAEFPATVAFFADNPAASRSLVSPDTQALLYTLVRNLRARCVVEIGSFRCGTAEAIARALHANGSGHLFTVDPFGAGTVPPIIAWWPPELQRHVRFFPANSADFFMDMDKQGLRPDLVFVDGNHDYEFALFDIQCGARRVTNGGFICVDNISQPGPFFAAVDFLKANQQWAECGTSAGHFNFAKAFDRERTSIHNTDMTVLRAPAAMPVGDRATTSGEQVWTSNTVQGLRLSLAPGHQTGVLHVQCVVRGFGQTEQVEVTGETTLSIDGSSTSITVSFEPPVLLEGEFVEVRVEPWLIWRGETPLRLLEPAVVW